MLSSGNKVVLPRTSKSLQALKLQAASIPTSAQGLKLQATSLKLQDPSARVQAIRPKLRVTSYKHIGIFWMSKYH